MKELCVGENCESVKSVLGCVKLGSDFCPAEGGEGCACMEDVETICKKTLGYIRLTAEYCCCGGDRLPAEQRVSIRLSKAAAQLAENGKLELEAIVGPVDLEDKSVSWASSDPAVALVDENGVVTAVGIGTATITATTNIGGKTAICVVTVKADGENPGDIDPDEEYPHIGLGNVPFDILAYDDYGYNWTPENALDGDLEKRIVWGGKYEHSVTWGYAFPRNYVAIKPKTDGYLNVHGCNLYVGNPIDIYGDKNASSKIGSVATNGYNWTKFQAKLEAGKTYYLGGFNAVIIQMMITKD